MSWVKVPPVPLSLDVLPHSAHFGAKVIGSNAKSSTFLPATKKLNPVVVPEVSVWNMNQSFALFALVACHRLIPSNATPLVPPKDG